MTAARRNSRAGACRFLELMKRFLFDGRQERLCQRPPPRVRNPSSGPGRLQPRTVPATVSKHEQTSGNPGVRCGTVRARARSLRQLGIARRLGRPHRHDHDLRVTRRHGRSPACGGARGCRRRRSASADAAPRAQPSVAKRLASGPRGAGRQPSAHVRARGGLASGRVVFSHNASLALAPASNEKLPVSFAALVRLGPGYRFRTEVLGDGTLVGGTWRGDLYLKGYGDPTLTRWDMRALAAQLRAWGIRRVAGRVLGDESWFDARRDSRRLEGGLPRRGIAAAVGARRRARRRLARSVACAARREGARHGARAPRDLRGAPARDREGSGRRAAAGARPLEAAGGDRPVRQPGLRQLRRRDAAQGARSRRRPARHVGGRRARSSGRRSPKPEYRSPGRGSWTGPGSRGSTGSPPRPWSGFCRAAAADPDVRDAFVSSLAVAGVDGTLDHRLERRPAYGRVIAKTGTTMLASCLSGFVRGRYVFAILQNGSPIASWSARSTQDRFVTVLARLQ